MIKDIERGGKTYHVNDTEITASWEFWKLWSEWRWEPETFGVMQPYLDPGKLLFDVGAWVGPITLWAAIERGANVVAFEPDPYAFDLLAQNVALNDLAPSQVYTSRVALSDRQGTAPLEMQLGGGNSASSLTRPMNDMTVTVDTRTMASAIELWGRPDLVKMDIEGGEAIVMPAAGLQLRELGIPLVISLHPGWYGDAGDDALNHELANWIVVKQFGAENNSYLLVAR